ncbi:MAG: ABC transporter permease [candidate division Zixibacteria bacterium]|nr:ABC transporter permease [candidate division Zixibacteria bacterium]
MKDSIKKGSTGFFRSTWYKRFISDYGMVIVLAGLCLLFSLLTITEQHPTGVAAAEDLLKQIRELVPGGGPVLVVTSGSPDDSEFVRALKESPRLSRLQPLSFITGTPSDVRARMTVLDKAGQIPQYIITTHASSAMVDMITSQLAVFKDVAVLAPTSHKWPTFLMADNIRNVANQITVIAIIAIGMTMVIITAGIDLSVGSMIALSAVVVAWLVGRLGGEEASNVTMIIAALGGIILCGGVGAFSGLMVTAFRIPPFIATLAMMQVAAGLGYIISQGRPIYQLPDSFVWLGRGVDPLLHIPIAVILMLVLYALAHLVMSRTTYGRYIYAVGGNLEAARLAGIRVKLVLFSVYTICGMLAGLGGVVMASQLKSGAPTYGLTYELYVIAAVVVGGTSLMGGEGRILGTLIGAFIIAVIQNGMNLVNVESYTQKVVLGLVILAAVLVDRLKQRNFNFKALWHYKKKHHLNEHNLTGDEGGK